MNQITKRALSLFIAMVMVISLIPAVFAVEPETLSMKYDDQVGLTIAENQSLVVISQTVRSNKYGSEKKDTSVVTYVDGKLIATGVGTATVQILNTDNTVSREISVTVTAAPISLFMITGHSMGYGQSGNGAQSVVCESGQSYSTTNTNSGALVNPVTGIGYGSTINGIHAFDQGAGGTIGEDSGFAYEWNRQTGEKVWILNAAVGGASLTQWKKGADYYNAGVTLFRRAEAVLAKEIAAGHYTLSHMGIINHTTANGDQTWEVDRYFNAFQSMWQGFKTDLAYDMDGDQKTETVEFIGLVPIWTINGQKNLNNGKYINYYMSAAASFADVFMASSIGREWVTNEGVASHFGNIDYTTQSSPVTKPSTTSGIFAGDGVHYQQVAYNEIGREIAGNVVHYLKGNVSSTTVTLLTADGTTEVGNTVALEPGATLEFAPFAMPLYASDLTFAVSGNISFLNNGKTCSVVAGNSGNGTLIISNAAGQTLKTIAFTIGDSGNEDDPVLPTGGSWSYWETGLSAATEKGSAANTLTKQVGDVTVSEKGITGTDAILQMSAPVSFSNSKNWGIEFTYAAKETASRPIFSDIGDVANSVGNASVWVTKAGELVAIVYTNGSFKWYATERQMDVVDITQEHTYALENRDGSWYVYRDGVCGGKLGVYCVAGFPYNSNNERSGALTSEAPAFDFSIQYIGAQNSANRNANWKLHGTLKDIRLCENASAVVMNANYAGAAAMSPMTANPADPQRKLYPNQIITLPEPMRQYYMLLGWSTEQNGETLQTSAFTVRDVGTTTLYAQWLEAPEGYCSIFDSSVEHATIRSAEGYRKQVASGQAYCFTVEIASGYQKSNDFAVKANGNALTPDANGIYTISDIRTDQTITVEGIQEIPTYTVSVGSAENCTVTAVNDSTAIVTSGGTYAFTVTIAQFYKKNEGFAVKANGYPLEETDGIYTISDIQADQIITVEGIELDQSSNTFSKTFVDVYTRDGKHVEVPTVVTNGTVQTTDEDMVELTTGQLQLTRNIQLLTDKNWAVEFTMRGVPGKSAPVLSSVQTIGNVQGETLIWLVAGNLDFVQYNGGYQYYMVKHADFVKNIPSEYSQDQLHTYRLEKNGQKYSYYLDGDKIGDYSVRQTGYGSNGVAAQVTATPDFGMDGQYMGIRGFGASTGWCLNATFKNMTVFEDSSTIEFSLNGAEGEVPATISTKEVEGNIRPLYPKDAISLPAAPPRIGYTFAGWKVRDMLYSANSTYTVSATGNTVMVAQWTVCDHSGSDKQPTCTESVICSVCNGTIPATGHTLTPVAQVNATCTEAGVKAYWTCETCHKNFSDAEGNSEISDLEDWKAGDGKIAATGHTLTPVAQVDATYFADGVKAHDHCSVCNKNFIDGEEKTDDELRIPKLTRPSGGGNTSNVITVENTKHGDVSLTPKSASRGTTVTITVEPDDGYKLDTLTVTDGSGNVLKLTDKGNGKYTFTMPSSGVSVKASFVLVNPFVDVSSGAYYYDAVLWAVENGITEGTSATTFSPNAPCTRAQMVTFLWRAAGCPEPKGISGFEDVAADTYYAKAVAWAVENGITEGVGENKFAPDAVCTRAQMAAFLCRMANGKASSSVTFTDVSADAYYAEAVQWAAENGITFGTGDGSTFSPDETCTRGQMVTFLYRYFKG